MQGLATLRQKPKQIGSFVAYILTVLILALLPLQPLSAENVGVRYGYTYDFEIESFDDYSELYAIETDSDNNVYLLGQFSGTVDMDLTSGVDEKTAVGRETFLIKLDVDGNYLWSLTWAHDFPSSLAIDASDNLYIAAQYSGTLDFDPTSGTDNIASAGSFDAGIIKLASDGSYIDGYSMGGAGVEYPADMVVDAAGTIYVAGRFTLTADMDPTNGVDNKVSAGGQDIFLTKLNADGTYGWTYAAGSADSEQAGRLTVAPNGNVYVAGVFGTAFDFDPSGSTDTKSPTGAVDIWLTKLNSAGTYQSTRVVGNANSDTLVDVNVDGQNNLYLTGHFSGTVDFDPGAGTDNKAYNGAAGSDGFMSKYNSDDSYDYTYTWGSTDSLGEYVGPVEFDSDNNVYLYGSFGGSFDADPTAGVSTKAVPSNDHYVIKLDASGGYEYAYGVRIPDDDSYIYTNDNTMAVDSDGDIYYGATFGGPVDLNPLSEIDTFNSAAEDLFVTKIDQIFFQQIDGLDDSLVAETKVGEDDATQNVIERDTTVTIRLKAADDESPIADVRTEFDSDLDWSDVDGDSDANDGVAFAHNLTDAEGTGSTFSLYIPKLGGDTAVGICPGSTSLAATNEDCDDIFYLDDDDARLSTVTINDVRYWKVTGLTGTGGFSADVALASTGDGSGGSDSDGSGSGSDSDGSSEDGLAGTGSNSRVILLTTFVLLGASMLLTKRALVKQG